ncbi:hypothetical protein M406DRAFT_328297 [Cryphonectria parasitica EP155]|uniref:Hydrophobin n=1 Tax=Cryphonectria parasitica (strain ATCC 38755 / EP155) TaxID=660469 RepID=A0A9P4Y6D6_CRYP1|nr:uncharacterized protein M406DRAFT_328297 [Cryphonectria parasitica EP155]KAF3767202.1 hypothetical protein M406DRAFT_328297 [Cryphonectria parasitica EP155]
MQYKLVLALFATTAVAGYIPISGEPVGTSPDGTSGYQSRSPGSENGGSSATSTPPSSVGSGSGSVPGGTTLGQAQQACGDDSVLSCCNQETESGDTNTEASGLLSGLLGGILDGDAGLGLLSGCSKISILGEADRPDLDLSDILGSQCSQTAACCSSGNVDQSSKLIGPATVQEAHDSIVLSSGLPQERDMYMRSLSGRDNTAKSLDTRKLTTELSIQRNIEREA